MKKEFTKEEAIKLETEAVTLWREEPPLIGKEGLIIPIYNTTVRYLGWNNFYKMRLPLKVRVIDTKMCGNAGHCTNTQCRRKKMFEFRHNGVVNTTDFLCTSYPSWDGNISYNIFHPLNGKAAKMLGFDKKAMIYKKGGGK